VAAAALPAHHVDAAALSPTRLGRDGNGSRRESRFRRYRPALNFHMSATMFGTFEAFLNGTVNTQRRPRQIQAATSAL
jgi:hypothetical protein